MGEAARTMGEWRIMLEADDSHVVKITEKCKDKLKKIDEQTYEAEFNVRHAIVRSARVLTGIIGIAQNVFGVLGGVLDPVGQALVGCVTASISAMQSIAIAMGSNPITAFFAITTGAASIILSVKTLWDVTHGIDVSKDEMRRVNDALRTAHSTYVLMKGLEW